MIGLYYQISYIIHVKNKVFDVLKPSHQAEKLKGMPIRVVRCGGIITTIAC
mgnify:CR=1 FL=1